MSIKRIFKNEIYKIALGFLVFGLAFIFDLFDLSVVSVICYILSLLVCGSRVFFDALRGILRRDFLDEKFLMSIASVGAVIIGEYAEGAGVMLFFLVGEYFEHKAVKSSRRSIKSLMDIRPDTARVIRDGTESVVDAEDVQVGDLILIRPGERAPVDCLIVEGEAELDTAALTGESLLRFATTGDRVDSGVVVLGSAIKCRCIRTAENSAAARVLELVENATENKSRQEAFITSFSHFYTPIVTALALLMAILPPLFRLLTFSEALYRALSFLVVSCPCALVISVPMAFFGGIGGAASSGILYKGGSVFSSVSRVRCAVFDKTGTLTAGEFELSEVEAYGVSESELLLLAASAESQSNHPIAKAIAASSESIIRPSSVKEITGRGVVAKIEGDEITVGSAAILGITEHSSDGAYIYVGKNGKLIGKIGLKDKIKPEARTALNELRSLGVKKTVMLTGDTEYAAAGVASSLGIDELHSRLMPEDKYAYLRTLIDSGTGPVLYVGDGINDSPCLAGADVGIAMGKGGTDAAVEAADAVIMSDSLDKLPEAIKIARKTLRIAKQNIVFAIGVKLAVLLLVSLSVFGMWMAVFADVGVAVLAILNSMRTLRINKKTRT